MDAISSPLLTVSFTQSIKIKLIIDHSIPLLYSSLANGIVNLIFKSNICSSDRYFIVHNPYPHIYKSIAEADFHISF
ncbi:hypothetical protein L1987_45093 [Smallanthus sonchifolius]|uniref:Uncharacterized protein n=1 Tax=Smallanthus sonchifolius TaxID=185202 RepID=A0ACB9GTF2_9ASTR|nr:hypothetical protein L1987_45093 [Smallanthus sonchifolius]